MPQKWKEYWSVDVLPVFDDKGEKIPELKDAEEKRSRAVYEIGNMTLLNSKLNTSLRNYTFDRKKAGEGRKKGMKNLADCMITRAILDEPIWNEQAIYKRTNEISDSIMTLWSINF